VDKLTVKGVGKRVDGDYDCDIRALLIDVSSPDALLVSEAETIKKLCGATGFDIARGFVDDDWTVQMAVALVVLARHGVDLSDQQARQQRVGAFRFELAQAADQEEDETESPPDGGMTPSPNGGSSGPATSASPPETVPAPTGRLASVGS
jgi:hypothetical protein